MLLPKPRATPQVLRLTAPPATAAAALAAVPDLPTVDLPGIELCTVGTWNDRPYTAAEFDEAAKTAGELAGQYLIPLKLGHDDEQRLVQNDGYPAIGWVENVRRRGQSLIGDFKQVPEKLAQLIKAGAYRTRSAEFWTNTIYGGKARPFMLKAVSLLGADEPAVESMSDILALYNARVLQNRTIGQMLGAAAQATVTLTYKPAQQAGGTPVRRSLVETLRKLPEPLAAWLIEWKKTHPTVTKLISGPPLGDIQSAVEKALAAQFPPAEGDGEVSQDGPSQNVVDWFVAGTEQSVIVSDQDVDNLWEIPFQYNAATDTATLGSPTPVKGTYTPAEGGTESGEPGGEEPGEQQPPAEEQQQMARRQLAELQVIVGLAELKPDVPALQTLARTVQTEAVAHLAGSDVQKAVAKILSALDQTIASLAETAGGKPGMGFIRTTLAEVKRKLAAMKFPAPATAQNSRLTAGGTDVDLKVLAKKLGLPETATEAQIEARLAAQPAQASAPETPAAVATLVTEVASLKAERQSERLTRLLDGAATDGKLTPPLREELVKLSRAGVDIEPVIKNLPVVVDLTERGRDGDGPQQLGGQLSRGAITILTRDHGRGVVERLADTRPLAEKAKDPAARAAAAARVAAYSGQPAPARR